MADLEQRVDNLEKEVSNIKLELNTSLSNIQSDVSIIKEKIMGSNSSNDLKNELIGKDIELNAERIDNNSKRIGKLEDNQSKVVWTIIGEIVAAIAGAIIYFIKHS